MLGESADSARDSRASRVLSWSLILSVLACLAALGYQHVRLTQLAQAQRELADQLTSELASLKSRLAAQEESTSALIHNAAALAPGLYVLGPKNENGVDEEDAYTIYHIAATVRAGDFERDVQFGAARSGLVSWLFYFDYDNDGRVDTDMLREFVDSIPFGSYVSGSLDDDRSQRVYGRFLESSSEAEYTPPERIEEQSGAVALQTWSFVTSASEQLAGWIRSRLENEIPAVPSQESLE